MTLTATVRALDEETQDPLTMSRLACLRAAVTRMLRQRGASNPYTYLELLAEATLYVYRSRDVIGMIHIDSWLAQMIKDGELRVPPVPLHKYVVLAGAVVPVAPPEPTVNPTAALIKLAASL